MQQDRSKVGAIVGGAIMIAFGLLSLAGQLFRALNWGFFWPFIIIAFGALFFVGMFAGGKQAAAMAIPGNIIGGIGLILLFQNITRHWESMSYFWTLIILFIGTGIYIMGWYSGDDVQKQSGQRVIKAGVILFVIFGAFFEMIFSRFNNVLFPAFLILLGAYLIVSRMGLFHAKNNGSTNSLPPAS